jgi:hypothetical protein
MKNYIFYLLLIFFCPVYLFSKNVPEKDAIKIAKIWMKKNYSIEVEIRDIYIEKYNNESSFFVINFVNGGFVIISADDKINPILAYNRSGVFEPEINDTPTKALLTYYKEKIAFVKANKTETNNKKTRGKWNEIMQSSNVTNTNKSVLLTVPSLFETEQSSRWGTWGGYNIMMPDQNADNSCANLAMAQICKFHKFPKQGTGTHSYTQIYNGTTYNWSIDFSKHLYNYDLMPFRLTYCGNGGENCNEGSFDFLPGITTENMQEVSKIIYHIGLGIEKGWFGLPSYTWLDDWASVFVNNLGYKSTFTYWSETEILNRPEDFKSEMRNNLVARLPIFYRVAGHAIVIDGFENDNYFHCAFGRGGFTDGYYYLFNSDADGVHLLIPGSSDLDALTNLEPNYSFPSNVNIFFPIAAGTTKCYQASKNVSFSSIIDGGSSGGANISAYAKEVLLSPGFEIKIGATLYINNEVY